MTRNHTAMIAAEAERPYALRCYILSELDDHHFDALNEGDHLCGLNGYCLDALDELPAGSMSSGAHLTRQVRTVRGMTLAELQALDALADELIAEILAEESRENH